MAYKIEDIDWSKMPEGAVEFSLCTDDYNACWYNNKGEYMIFIARRWIKEDDPDTRPRYKVVDHHPDMQRNQWRGHEDGFPPKGMACEAYVLADTENQGASSAEWKTGIIEGVALAPNYGIAGIFRGSDDRCYIINDYSHFRPIRSERDEWCGKATKMWNDHPDSSAMSFAEVIYDAIKSGKLSAPEVEK